MAEKPLNLFLSASVPISGRADGKYLVTADVIAIRDAVIALASVVMPHYRLIWGGHPSITPLIANVLRHSNRDVNECVTLYQSRFFVKEFPKENKDVERVVITEALEDMGKSLELMRRKMIVENDFVAAVFIGGMNGVEEEYKMFVENHPNAKVIPVASTGAAALILYESNKDRFDERLKTDLAYSSLFKDILMTHERDGK